MAKIVYLIIFVLILIFQGRVVNAILVNSQIGQIKRVRVKVFISSFLIPILFVLTIFIVLLTGNYFFNIYISFGVIVASSIRIFFSEDKYFAVFNTNNAGIEIEYFSSILKLKKVHLNFTDINESEFVKANWFFDGFDSFNIKINGKWKSFYIVEKSTKEDLKKLF